VGKKMSTSDPAVAPETIVEVVTETPSYWKRMLSYDERMLVRVRKWEVPWITRVMRAFTNAGNASSWWVLGLGMFAIGGAARRPALLLGTATLIATVASQAVKRTASRARPNPQILGLSALTEYPDRFSFPSGHTTAAFAVAIALQGEGAALGPASLALAVGIAMSRVYLGQHYPLDVAAGAVLGSCAGLAARAIIG
jgi:undecaprenyl-diphosphatase